MIRNIDSQITRYYLSVSKTLENISISVFEWLVILVGCKIKGINENLKVHRYNYAHYNSRG